MEKSMIYLFLAEGFEEIEALTPVDVLRRASLELKTVAVGNSKTVKGAHGIEVVADLLESELSDEIPEAVILPGGMPGTLNLENSEVVIDTLSRAMINGSLVCAICAAPSILGISGYLKHKKATCYPGFEQYLDGATFIDERVVHDGRIITAKGMGCAAEFALCIVEALCGKEKADEVALSAIIK
jgi:4-methyl-5(b-hydroxyethyl)-thiazole monophosphate biosynthesis